MSEDLRGHQVYGWLDQSTGGVLSKLVDLFPDATRMYVVGGAVRDFFLGGKNKPADLDVTLEGVAGSDLVRVPGVKTNAFGGPVIEIDKYWIDIWALEDTARLAEYGLPKTIDGVLDRFVFNLERISLEAKSREIVDRGCLQGIDARCIDYDPPRPHSEAVQAARLVILKYKTGFSYSPRARDLLVRAKRMIEDPNEWVDVVRFFHTAGKYTDMVDQIRQEIISGPGDLSFPPSGSRFKNELSPME